MTNEAKQIYIKEEKKSYHSEIHGNNHHKSPNITDKQQGYMKDSQDHQHQNHQEPISHQYSVKLHFDSVVPEAGRKTMLTISAAEKSGTPIREFELVHDKLMHLIIVGQDLSYLHISILFLQVLMETLLSIIYFQSLAYTNYGLIISQEEELRHL
jgi:hypothetical protein